MTGVGVRVDPFYDGLWESSAAVLWDDPDQREEFVRAGFGPDRSRWDHPLPEAEAMGLLVARQSRLLLLGAVFGWGTLTTQQIAALTGCGGHGSLDGRDYWLAYSARLIRVGRPSGRTAMRWLPGVVDFRSSPAWGRLRNFVSFDQWCGVTGGVPRGRVTRGDRHNVLASEIGLRIGEQLAVPACFGEGLGHVGLYSRLGGGRSADVVAVRADGLRIMIELSASAAGIVDKAEHWAQVLAADRRRSLVVVFVEAFPPWGRQSKRSVRRAVREAGSADMGRVVAGVPGRMGVVDWPDWFPARHECSDGFGSLVAQVWDRDGWVPRRFLDPFDVPGPEGDGWLSVLHQLPYLYGVCHSQREAAPRGVPPSRLWAACNP